MSLISLRLNHLAEMVRQPLGYVSRSVDELLSRFVRLLVRLAWYRFSHLPVDVLVLRRLRSRLSICVAWLGRVCGLGWARVDTGDSLICV